MSKWLPLLLIILITPAVQPTAAASFNPVAPPNQTVLDPVPTVERPVLPPNWRSQLAPPPRPRSADGLGLFATATQQEVPPEGRMPEGAPEVAARRRTNIRLELVIVD
jgi:hypothetical protein